MRFFKFIILGSMSVAMTGCDGCDDDKENANGLEMQEGVKAKAKLVEENKRNAEVTEHEIKLIRRSMPELKAKLELEGREVEEQQTQLDALEAEMTEISSLVDKRGELNLFEKVQGLVNECAAIKIGAQFEPYCGVTDIAQVLMSVKKASETLGVSEKNPLNKVTKTVGNVETIRTTLGIDSEQSKTIQQEVALIRSTLDGFDPFLRSMSFIDAVTNIDRRRAVAEADAAAARAKLSTGILDNDPPHENENNNSPGFLHGAYLFSYQLITEHLGPNVSLKLECFK